MRYFDHITITTGHTVRQYCNDVTDETVARLQSMLDIALQSSAPTAVPGVEGATITATAPTAKTLLATVWIVQMPIITVGVALKSRGGAELWRMMVESATTPVAPRISAGQQPPAPWIADRIEAGAAQHASTLSWTGDFSRCLAWAWAEY